MGAERQVAPGERITVGMIGVGRQAYLKNMKQFLGMITNWGTHLDDGSMWCTGLELTGPVEVEGTGKYPPPEGFWNVLLKFEIKYREGMTWASTNES
jgi:hypothetical protein